MQSKNGPPGGVFHDVKDTSTETAKKDESTSDGDTFSEDKEWCPCNAVITGENYIACDSCELWWHLSCVALKGLTAEMIQAIEAWVCPDCYVSPRERSSTRSQQKRSEGSIDLSYTTIRMIVKEELNLICPVLKATISDTVKSGMDATYAQVTQGQKDIIEEVKVVTAAPPKKMIEQVCRIMDSSQLERETKKTNIVVNWVPEQEAILAGSEKKERDILFLVDKLEVRRDDIVTCHRAGKPGRVNNEGKPIPRPLVVQMINKKTADYYHNDGKGYPTKLENGTVVWTNADLCFADREARFLVREKGRAAKEKAEAEKKKVELKKKQAIKK